MHFIFKTLPLLALANMALAGAYAEFCNDDNCSEGCGMSVDVNNPGCLTQYSRRSVRLHNWNADDISLVASPGAGCDCQNYCETRIVEGGSNFFNGDEATCFKLRDEPAQSFRFIRGGCPADQC